MRSLMSWCGNKMAPFWLIVFLLLSDGLYAQSTGIDRMRVLYEDQEWEKIFTESPPLLKQAFQAAHWDQYTELNDYYMRSLEKLKKTDAFATEVQALGKLQATNSAVSNRVRVSYYFWKALEGYFADDVVNATNYAKKADSLAAKAGIAPSLLAARMYNVYGILLDEAGRLLEAEKIYLKALNFTKGSKPHHLELQSAVYNNLGTLYKVMGRKQEALEFLNQDLKLTIALKGEFSSDVGISYYNIGNVYLDAGDSHMALDFFNQAEKIISKSVGETSREAGLLYNSVGIAYRNLEQFDKAERSYLKSIKARETTYSRDHAQVAVAQNNLASLYLDIKKPQQALKFARSSVRIRTKSYDPHDSRLYFSRFNLARIFVQTGKIDSAHVLLALMKETAFNVLKDRRLMADYYTVLVELAEKERNPMQVIRYNREIMRVLQLEDAKVLSWRMPSQALPAAEKLFETGVKQLPPEQILPFTDTLIANFFAVHNGQDNVATLKAEATRFRKMAALATTTAISAWQKTGDSKHLDKALEFAALSKAVALRRLIRENQALTYSGVPEAELNRQKELFKQINRLESELAFNPDEKGELSDSLVKFLEMRITMLNRFSVNYPNYYAVRFSDEKQTAEFIKKQIQPDELRIDLFHSDSTHLVFKVQKERVFVSNLPTSPVFFDSLKRFSTAVLENRAEEIQTLGKNLGERLYKMMLFPGVKRLTINPDGVWSSFPFDVLQMRDGTFWADHLEIRYLPPDGISGVSDRTTQFQYAGIAPVYFSDVEQKIAPLALRGKMQVGPLPYTAQEVTDAKRIFDEQAPWYRKWTGLSGNLALLKDQATEEAVRNLPYSTDLIVHFATHALIDTEFPARSRLLLKPGGEHDGLLIQQEIFGMKTPAALIVLSSCASATGEVIPGEGVWGLTAAFRYAGAQRMVATLWPVSDKPAAAFAALFFEELATGLQPAAALRKAKVKARNRPKEFRPRDWSGYVLYE